MEKLDLDLVKFDFDEFYKTAITAEGNFWLALINSCGLYDEFYRYHRSRPDRSLKCNAYCYCGYNDLQKLLANKLRSINIWR